jgi:hypothetical protein
LPYYNGLKPNLYIFPLYSGYSSLIATYISERKLQRVLNMTYGQHNLRQIEEHFLQISIPFLKLKVPKREIFDRSDFPDFYTIKSLHVGDFGVKIRENLVHLGVQSSLRVCSVYF